jgi:intracellular protein transport protein USO1
LLILAFTPKIPLKVSASALNCLSGLIWSNNRTQQEFANQKLIEIPTSNCLMKIEPPISPLMAAIVLAVHGRNLSEEGVEQRIEALKLVEAFCSNNYEGQLVLLSTLKDSGSASPGTVILDALFDLDSSRKRDPWHCWYASILLSHLIDRNEEAKKVLLNHQFVDPDIEDEGEDLLTSLMLNMMRTATDSRGSTCQKSIIGYLQLLVIWFHESPSSIKAFLSESSFLQYLLERITQQPQELEIQGFSALIFGICVLFNDETIERVGSEALKGIIKNRIGPDLFVSRLSRLKGNSDKVKLSSLNWHVF